MIDIRLKVFRSVALNLSFTKASQELYISQPAISKHIRELEREYDVSLFDRMGNKIALTPAGQKLLEHANCILKDYQRLEFEMKALQNNCSGELHMGASTTISQYVMPAIMADFHRRYPNIRLSMLSGNSREIEAALDEGRIEVGMVEGIKRLPQLKYTSFMDDELVAIVSTKNKFHLPDTITLDQLLGLPIVIREFGSGTLDVIQKELGNRGRSLSDLHIEMNFGTTEGIKHYVEHTDCVGILSIRSVSMEIYNGVFRIVEIENLDLNRSFALVEKRGESSPLVEKFKNFITKGYKQ